MLRNVGLRKSVEQPVLDLNFAASQIGSNGAPDGRMNDFNRGSNAWFVDSDGLVKKSPHNLLVRSEDLTTASFTKSFVTVTNNAASAPDGTTTATKLEKTANTFANVNQNFLGATATHAASLYLKAGTNTTATVLLTSDNGSTLNSRHTIDLSAGTITDISSASMVTTTIEDVGDGWYRFTTIATFANSTNTRLYIYPDVYNSSNAGFVYIWHPQVSQHTTLPVDNPYVKTEASAVYAARLDHDPTWFMSAAQEQNLLQYSEMLDNSGWTKYQSTVTANAAVAPDGTTTAEKLASSNTLEGAVIQDVEGNPSVTYVFSIYLKKDEFDEAELHLNYRGGGSSLYRAIYDVDLTAGTIAYQAGSTATTTITDDGDGWFRVTISQPSPASTDTVRAEVNAPVGNASGDGILVWGAQLEVGSTASTYHRTEGAPYYGPGATPKGLLIEEQRANLITDSEDFSAASWLLSPAANLQLNTNQVLAPDGTTTADELEVTGTPSANVYKINDSKGLTSGQTYVGSVFGKKSEQRYLVLLWEGAALSAQVKGGVDLETGNIITGSDASTVVEDYGNGWYRVSISATAASSAAAACSICINDADDITVSHTPTAGDSIYIWGAQIEEGSFPTSYIKNSGTPAGVTRNADVATMGPTTGGTELVTNGTFDTSDISEWTASNNTTLSVSSGELSIVNTQATGTFQASYPVTGLVANRRYRVSYDRRTISGSGIRAFVQDGTLGVLIEGTYSSGDNTETLDFTAPDEGVSFTLQRNSPLSSSDEFAIDNLSVRELYPFEQYNPAEMTIVSEHDMGSGVIWSAVDDANSSFDDNMYFTSSNFVMRNGGTTTGSVFSSDTTAGKLAAAFKENDVQFAADGAAGTADTSTAIPATDKFSIGTGSWSGSTNFIDGTIKRLTFYNRRLPDETLEALTDD